MLRRLVLLAFVSACGLFPDLGPLSGGDDAGGNDATADVTSDVKPANDAANDAPPSDAGSDVKTSPCAAKHTFCDDFDKGTLGATWDYTNNGGGGTLSQTTNAVTPPYALQAIVPGGGGHPYAMLQKYLAASPHVHFECDLMIVGSQSNDMEIDYFDFAFVPTGYSYGDFNLEQLNPGGTAEEISRPTGADASAYNDDNFNKDLTSWRHLVIDIDYTKSTFTYVVDGVTVDAMSMNPVLTATQATLGVGATYVGGLQSQWSVLVDNVVIDLQ
jgi:hypothetical protein